MQIRYRMAALASVAAGPDDMFITLTGREVSLICLIAGGLTNWQIGKELMISPHTVAQHVAEMLRRYNARSRCELVARAYSAGVLQTGVWPPRTAVPNTAPQPRNPSAHDDHASTPGQDVPSLKAHHIVTISVPGAAGRAGRQVL